MFNFIPISFFPVVLITVSCIGFAINIRGFIRASVRKKHLTERGEHDKHKPYPMIASPFIYTGVILFSIYMLNFIHMKGW
jgi:hypothetical protein